MTRPKLPQSLDQAGRQLWRSITGAYELAPAELETLRQACRVADLLARLDTALADSELATEAASGRMWPNPLLQVSADQRRVLDALFRSMNLPMPDETTGRRRSPAAVAAAQARWRARSG